MQFDLDYIYNTVFRSNCPSKGSFPITVSFLTFKIAFWRSQIPLLQGASAAVVFTFMLKFLQKSINYFDGNSPPLSLNTVFGLPNKLIQYFRNIFVIMSVDLLFIITALLNLENLSQYKYHKFGLNWCIHSYGIIKIICHR